MPFCSKCGNEIKNDDAFCPVCGTPNRFSEQEKAKNSNEKQDFTRYKTDVSSGGSYGLDARNLSEGTQLDNGRYTILEKLGEGAFGVVYKASDSNYEGDLKALKVIYSENYSDRLVMHKLKSEARNMIKINHPNVVRLYDIHFQGEMKFLDMEYVDGGDLVGLMLKCPDYKIAEDKVWDLAIQIAKGMQAIHKQNLIHQDLKPENILLTNDGQVKITDFGISEHFRSSKSRIEETNIKGTYVYASPEQLIGKNVGKEADVWSFGTTLYHILTGETLYSGNTSGDVITQIKLRSYESVDYASEKINNLLSKCLKRDYKERLKDFGEVVNIINSVEISNKNLATKKTSTKPESQAETKKQAFNKDSNDPEGLIIDGMVFVQGGTFQMGSKNGDSDEKPVHSVALNNFYIGKYQVTQAEYESVMGKNPSYHTGDNMPVESVSWYDIAEYCNKKSLLEELTSCYTGSGKDMKCDFSANGYRLPTEAEWEYAARGGDKSKGYKYSGSDDIGKVAWYIGNSGSKTHSVGQKQENELDLYDMSGNVWEWCWDWYEKKYYKNSPKNNPKGPSSGIEAVLRGGSWFNYAYYCRVSYRNKYHRDNSYYGVGGFRIVRKP